MKKTSYVLLSFNLLFLSFEAFAKNAADVVFYHYRTSLHDNHVDQYSLFPQEIHIGNFPPAISTNETDLAVLQGYYREVSQAYQTYLESAVTPKLAKYKEKIAAQQQSLHLTQVKSATGKNQFSRHLTQRTGKFKEQDRTDQTARIKAITYYGTTYKNLSAEAETLKKKAEFYQELSETSEELYRGEIH